ncbi:MAG: RnfABCDGE type electron transport complex subunit D [Brevinemataceae bacterium]
MKSYDNAFLISPFLRPKHHSKIILSDILNSLIVLFIGSVILFSYASLIIVGTALITGLIVVVLVRFFSASLFFKSPMWINSVLIFALSLSPSTPWYVVVIGVLVMLIFPQIIFSVEKQSIVYPVLLGRVFILAVFPQESQLTWPDTIFKVFPIVWDYYSQFGSLSAFSVFIQSSNIIAGFTANVPESVFDAVSHASPLSQYKDLVMLYSDTKIPVDLMQFNWIDLLLGLRRGALGETSILLLLLVFLWLSIQKAINPLIAVLYIFVFCFWTYLFGGVLLGRGMFFLPALQYSFFGGTLFAAIFLVSNFSFLPSNSKAQYVFVAVSAVLAATLRVSGVFADAHILVLLGMNLMMPIFERLFYFRVFASSNTTVPVSISNKKFSYYYFIRFTISGVIIAVSYLFFYLISESSFYNRIDDDERMVLRELFPEYTVETRYAPGVYTALPLKGNKIYLIFGKGNGYRSQVSAVAVIQNGAIINFKIFDTAKETFHLVNSKFFRFWEQRLISQRLEQFNASERKILAENKYVDSVSGVTKTSEAIIGAVKDIKHKFDNIQHSDKLQDNHVLNTYENKF